MTMPRRSLVMLTSLRPSSKYRQTVTRDEIEAFWHGYFALWHPAVVAASSGPPMLGSQDEYDVPQADHLFVMPESPYRYQAPEWADRVRDAGSKIVVATAEWAHTLDQLSEALSGNVEQLRNADWTPFAGLGMGYLLLEAYCDAQDHTNPLDSVSFYDLVRQAAQAQDEATRQHHLGQAAHQLQEAREVVNPAQFYQALSIFLTGNPSELSLEPWLTSKLPLSIVTGSSWLKQWADHHQVQFAELKQRLASRSIDWWGGQLQEQEDALLPTSAWLANLRAGFDVAGKLGSRPFESHGRSQYAASPVMPAILQSFGVKRALGFSNDSGVWPHFTNSLAAWRGPDSTLLESCTKVPEPVEHAETAFHLGHLLHESTSSEYVGWLHLGCKEPAHGVPLWLRCWAALHQLAPIFGHLGTLEETIRDIPATEQYTPTSADDFQSDYLLDLTGHGSLTAVQPAPISRFVAAQISWRQWEATRIIASLHAAITPSDPLLNHESDTIELLQMQSPKVNAQLEQAANALATRLTRGVTTHASGYLLFNPCSFNRKVPVHLTRCTTLLPAPAFASQKADQGVDAVIELPPLGYAWVPAAVAKGAKVRIPKQPIVEGNTLRNDYLILEVDPQTGGLRAIRDAVKQIPRLGQQLVFAPGSTMQCDGVRVVRNGHAVGEIEAAGKLVDAHGQVLASYRQTYRIWAGKKYAEIDVHLEPAETPKGYPWHAYFAARWAWRDPAAQVNKSVHWTKMPVQQTRPETPGFIELEMATGRTAIFSGGLPFWQRYSSRMLDTLLIVEGESAQDFKFALSLDDDLPHVTEQDWLTPAVVVPVDHGPPSAGVSSWLFHIDAPSVILFDMRATRGEYLTLTLRVMETFGYATDALLQCPVKPLRASVVNSLGEEQSTITVNDDGITLRLGCYELQQIQLQFAAPATA